MTTNDLDILFAQASEDLKDYLDALDSWPSAESPLERAEILLRLFGGSARIASAIDRMSEIEDSDYLAYARNYRKIFAQSEDAFQTLAQETDLVEPALVLLADTWGDRSRHELAHIRNLFREAYLYENFEWLADDYRQAVVTFLVGFNDLARTVDGVPPALRHSDAFGRLQGAVIQLEMALRQWHAYFDGAEEVLQNSHRREFGADLWWLAAPPPAFDPADHLRWPEEIYLEKIREAVATCPPDEVLEEYALRGGTGQWQSHIEGCPTCQDMVAAIKEGEAIRTGQAPIPAPLAKILGLSEDFRLPQAPPPTDSLSVPVEVVQPDGSRRPSAKVIPFPARKGGGDPVQEALDWGRCVTSDDVELPMAAATGSHERIWGKWIDLEGEVIGKISFFPLQVQQTLETEKGLLISLHSVQPFPTKAKFSCIWRNDSGTFVVAERLSAEEQWVTILFPTSDLSTEGRIDLLVVHPKD